MYILCTIYFLYLKNKIIILWFYKAITIFPKNPINGEGWNSTIARNAICKTGDLSGEKFIKCIEENAYTTEDIFSRYEVPNFLHYKLEISTFYMLVFYGLVKSLQINPINPEKNPITRYWIKLNGHLRYDIYFTDPKVQFISDDASLIPRTKFVLKENEGEMRIRLKVCYNYFCW